ncbi:hypothetical protein G6F68_019746 [Rhizopus microsporus]|nr:hypothetical protein G6F68_019746 [Rhizopus microsporus]
MVSEKVSSDPKKPSWESNLEQGSTDNNKDTSRLVGKDTDKVKGVWENKEKEDRATRQWLVWWKPKDRQSNGARKAQFG